MVVFFPKLLKRSLTLIQNLAAGAKSEAPIYVLKIYPNKKIKLCNAKRQRQRQEQKNNNNN